MDTVVAYVTPFGGATVITNSALSSLMISIVGIGASGSGTLDQGQTYLDNVTVSAIPEPTSLAVLSLAGLALTRRGRRTR